MPRRRGGRDIAARFVAWQMLLVIVVVGGAAVATIVLAQRAAVRSAETEVLAVARSVAAQPAVAADLTTARPTTTLQPLAEAVRRSSGVDFVVVMSPDGIRYSHPDPTRIGKRFLGHIDRARDGGTDVETYTGSLGPSVRAVVPVLRHGAVIGLVGVGISTATVGQTAGRQLPLVLAVAGVALALAVLGSVLIGRDLRRQTLGLGPPALARIFQSHDAVLHSMREGLLVIGENGSLDLINDEARRLLGVRDQDLGRPATEAIGAGSLAELVRTGRAAQDETHTTGGRIVLVSQVRAVRAGRHEGTVLTLRDRTELLRVAGERDQLRGFADSLRAVAHESANRLHTVVSLIELGRPDEAVGLATGQIAASQRLTDRLLAARDDEPELMALLLSQSARGAERGVTVDLDRAVLDGPTGLAPEDLLLIVGNLVDNAIDAVAGSTDALVRVELGVDGGSLQVVVTDNGPGISDLRRAFERGWSTKSDDAVHGRGLGLALVRECVERLDGLVEVSSDEGGACVAVELPLARPRA